VADAVYGVRETLSALRDLDRELYLAARASMRQAAEPLRADAAARLPSQPPLSGMARGRYAWTPAGTKVTTVLAGRAPKDKDTWPLVRVRLAGAAASVFDMAGRGSPGSSLATNLARKGYPRPSRAMWPAAEAHLPAVTAAVRKALEDTADKVSRNLAWKG
jgi:hypothetical protein